MIFACAVVALVALTTPIQSPAPKPAPDSAPPVAASIGPLPVGSARIEVDLDGTKLEVFTHKPADWRGERMLFVFHGVLRNADEYRDHAVVLAERYSMLVIAPRFDEERFPSIKYQRGGILSADGTAARPEEWTYALVPKLARAIRDREAKPALKHWLIGHSAGGQFCMRMAAFQDTGAERIIASNPGTALVPTRAQDFGYGFGKLPDELASDEILKRYLAAPLTLYLAQEDNKEDEYLDVSDAGMRQGPGRLQRNRAAFAAAESLAREKSWPCAWRIVEVPEVGHDHELMFQHPLAESALFGPPAAPPDPPRPPK
jgi:pimeloyl-ACP methyl ester carboxylesterase